MSSGGAATDVSHAAGACWSAVALPAHAGADGESEMITGWTWAVAHGALPSSPGSGCTLVRLIRLSSQLEVRLMLELGAGGKPRLRSGMASTVSSDLLACRRRRLNKKTQPPAHTNAPIASPRTRPRGNVDDDEGEAGSTLSGTEPASSGRLLCWSCSIGEMSSGETACSGIPCGSSSLMSKEPRVLSNACAVCCDVTTDVCTVMLLASSNRPA
eukprot:1528971-Rhodomonas_salina.2